MRVLVLTASTGGGHDMRARAFEAWAARLTDWDVSVHQTLEATHPLYRFGVGVYNAIQRRAPRLHHVYFNLLELASLHRAPAQIMGAKAFESIVRGVRPHVVLSTHAHLNHGFFALARRAMAPEKIRCVTYCGELSGGYGFSRHWVSRHADMFIGAVDATTRAARAHGLEPERTATGGFLLPPAVFEDGEPPWERSTLLTEELGLRGDAFTLLLATGAAGANNHVALLEAIHRSDVGGGGRLQCVVLCGRNERTLETVSDWAAVHPALAVRPLPHWRRMPELLRACDAAVARPGSGLASESVLCGCPLILNGMGGVMPQERLTCTFMTSRAAARFIRRPGELAPILEAWLGDPQAHARARSAVLAARPEAHPRDVLALVGGRAIVDRCAEPA